MGMKKGRVYTQCTDEQIKEALEKFYGVVKTSAEYLGMSRQGMQWRLRNNPDLLEFQKDCRNAGNDFATSKLLERIEAGELGAIMFWLKSQGKDRGFGETHDINFKWEY